jgi:lipopolysaccharide/colanic/teichoic acid biosynthesis glycosyltransferase
MALRAVQPPERNRRQHGHLVVTERLFRDALVRERKRADRFEESFALVLISLACPAGRIPRWTEVVDALTSQLLDTDLIGWFEEGKVIGLFRSLGTIDSGDGVSALAATVRHELARCLGGQGAAGCSIRLEVYTPHHENIPSVLVPAKDTRTQAREILRRGAKRALDVVGSLSLLTILAPAYVAIAAAVKLTSRGPVFFRQQRIGEAGRPFTMLKFRTMQMNADPAIHQQYMTAFITSDAKAIPAASGVFKIVDDPRVTSIGHFLRRSSLDELPQFWNVLKGEMSLVGPRPEEARVVAYYNDWHRRRLAIKPGVTGPMQVSGRGDLSLDERVRLELDYIDNYSFWRDLALLARTIPAVLQGDGAR